MDGFAKLAVGRIGDLLKRVADLEEGYREFLYLHDNHAGSVPAIVVSISREKLGIPVAQETREPEE